MKQQLWNAFVLLLGFFMVSGATAQPTSRPRSASDAARTKLIDQAGSALLDQIKCQRSPQVALVINAMLENRLIRYVDNENGIYLFVPTAPLNFLGLRVMHISGFGEMAFKHVPPSTMVGTAPPLFLEIDVAAPTSELRMRALNAGLVEAIPYEHKRGFEVSAEGYGSYLAPKSRTKTSSIRCTNY